MANLGKFALVSVVAVTLSACVEETATQLPGGMPTAAEQACLTAVARETSNGDVMVLGSEFSQAGTLVRIGVGPQRAPWQCIAYSDGSTAGIGSLINEGI